jgi:alginate O-acetyltransferase complex protein AlgJ
VLVGTSYSANDVWSFNSSLKLSLQQDVLNKAEEGKGFVIPMRNYLASLDSQALAPKLVIWEIPIRYFVAKIQP